VGGATHLKGRRAQTTLRNRQVWFLLSTARYVEVYRGRLGKFGRWRASRFYAGDVEATSSYMNDILATRDGLSGTRSIVRLVEEFVKAAVRGVVVQATTRIDDLLRPAAAYLSRARTRRTCGASHVPRPVAVGTPRVLRALAMPWSDVTPAACISATMGATSVALAIARALRASRAAIRAVAVTLPDLPIPLVGLAHSSDLV
jgi:hypothetical protein